MIRLLLMGLALILGLAACQTRGDVTPPREATIVIEKTIPLPDWLTAPVEKPVPRSSLLEALIESHDKRGRVIDYLLCRSRLAEKAQRGEPIKASDCEP
jgi:hypothetical protein